MSWSELGATYTLALFDPIAQFRDDHRIARDGLLEMSNALEAKDVPRTKEVLGNLNVLFFGK